MRIAFFCPTVSGTGGVESATRNLIAGFRELGDQTHLFLFGGSYDSVWLRDLEYTRFGTPEMNRWARIGLYAWGAAKAVAGWRPDAVICSDATTIQMARLGRRLAGKRDIALCSWIHYPLQHVRFKERLGQADLHLAISSEIARDLQALLPGQRDKVFTVFNAADIEEAFPVSRSRSASFLYVGRLTFDDQKRVNDLLLAVAGLRGEWKLKIIGAPVIGFESHGERLHSLAAELGIESRIEWLGWQPNAWKAAGDTTALVMPSGREGFPMVLVEALAHGIVCVSSDCESGPSEIIEPGRNGWLYPVADVPALTALLQALVDAPEALPTQAAVRETVLRFRASAIAQKARDAVLAVKAGAL